MVLTDIWSMQRLRVLPERVYVLSYLKIGTMVAALLCALVSTSLSFQQTAGGKKQLSGDNLTVTDQKSPEKPSNTTGMTLPGLGSLGVLPKLDFGL